MRNIKFLADENIGFRVIIPLRELDFNIKSILEDNRGSDDPKVLSLANQENRILITTDKDFGELVYNQQLIHAGVILLRLKKDYSDSKLRELHYLFKNHLKELKGEFTVINENKIRIGKKVILKQS